MTTVFTIPSCRLWCNGWKHGLRMPTEEIAFTAWPKIHSHSQIFWYGRSICCLPHRTNFSDIFELCLHWVSLVCGWKGMIILLLFGIWCSFSWHINLIKIILVKFANAKAEIFDRNLQWNYTKFNCGKSSVCASPKVAYFKLLPWY